MAIEGISLQAREQDPADPDQGNERDDHGDEDGALPAMLGRGGRCSRLPGVRKTSRMSPGPCDGSWARVGSN
jgi:hypothetical protein